MPFDVFPARFPAGEPGYVIADAKTGLTLPHDGPPRVWALHVSARRACDELNSDHTRVRLAAWERFGKVGGCPPDSPPAPPPPPKFVPAAARPNGFHLVSAANKAPALMPDGVTPIYFTDRVGAARFGEETERVLSAHAHTPDPNPAVRDAMHRAAAYYGYRLSDFVPTGPEDATTVEAEAVPADLTHALSELVMKYGPAAVKLAAAKW